MEIKRRVLIVVILLKAFFATSNGLSFVTRPHSLNISEGETANFSCTGIHTSSFGMSWRVNGTGLHDHIHRNIVQHQEEVLSGGARRSILTVPGIPINDNISVECVLSPFMQKSIYSGLAFLRIQGTLGVVEDVQLVQYNSSALRLTYSPPFTLVGVPISFFTITITSSDQATNITINTNTTQLLYSPPNICTDYLLKIAAWNKVGRGLSYFLVNGTLYRSPQEVMVHSKSLVFTATALIFVAKFDIDTQCSGTQPDNITVTLENIGNLKRVVYKSCPIRKHSIHCENFLSISKTNTVALVAVNFSNYLTFGNHYTAVIRLVNKGGASESKELTINTFNVQKVSTSVFQSKKCATCTFAEGTTATGCHIRFVDTTRNITAKAINAPRPDGALSTIGCVEDLPSGVYRIMAYDIVNDSGTDHRVAAVGESLVTVTASTTEISASTTMMVDTTKATQAADMTLLLSLIATVTGISVLAAGVIIIMVVCLVRYRAKARRHKFAEINAKRKQKELEETVAQSGQTYPSHPLHGDSLYDEISANNKHVFATQPCPAYAPLPPPRL